MKELQAVLAEYWPHIFFTLSFAAGAMAAIHAAMTKPDVRAAIGWVGIAIFSPLFGALFYLIAGINRVRHTPGATARTETMLHNARIANPTPQQDIVARCGAQFASLRTLGDRVGRFKVCSGNAVRALDGGAEAYPAMMEAVREAKRTIALQSYIFDNDAVGREMAQALIDAQQRGVEVRVLLDAVGAKYSLPPIDHLLHKGKVKTARFNTTPLMLWRMPYANLRSHRKVMVVDGRVGFTGGMNIRAAFVPDAKGRPASRDTHFRVEGPVVQQLMSVFAHDWDFATREQLDYETWFNAGADHAAGDIPMRCITTGPDRYIGSTHDMLMGALAVAQYHVRIQSPYFLPDQALIGALATAARRGVIVDIVIPDANNLKLVDYAMTAQLDQVVRTGCRIWRAHGTFDHSKIMTIDNAWSYVGSSNLDPRSLRLNFELDTEIYDPATAHWLSARVDQAIVSSRRVTLATLYRMPFIKRLRNKLIWLASPYL